MSRALASVGPSRVSRHCQVSRSGDLVFAEIGDEAVALNAKNGVCYGLNSVGLRILQLIDRPERIDEVCRQLIAVYEVDAKNCEREVIALLSELESEGLVVVERPSRRS